MVNHVAGITVQILFFPLNGTDSQLKVFRWQCLYTEQGPIYRTPVTIDHNILYLSSQKMQKRDRKGGIGRGSRDGSRASVHSVWRFLTLKRHIWRYGLYRSQRDPHQGLEGLYRQDRKWLCIGRVHILWFCCESLRL